MAHEQASAASEVSAPAWYPYDKQSCACMCTITTGNTLLLHFTMPVLKSKL